MTSTETTDKAPETQQKTFSDPRAQLIAERFISSPSAVTENADYEYNHFKPTFPNVDWEPLGDLDVTERGLFADREKKSLFASATKVKYLTPTIGVELEGINLGKLSDTQKDELALLIAERGVAVFRDQNIEVDDQVALGKHLGPLHRHPVGGVLRDKHHVHVVYTDGTRRPNPTAFTRIGLWASDVSFERQPPGVAMLRMITTSDVGGDTLWTSGYALYSSLSPGMQRYLEGLTAVHSGAAQAQSVRAQGRHVRRQDIETIHPVVRVHPATGWKSVFVNPAFTRRIVGIPKAESDTILEFLYRQISENPDFQVRFKWEKNSVAMWDNRVVYRAATLDSWPAVRHALYVNAQAEKPLSVSEYEKTTGKVAKDRQVEIWESQGIEPINSLKKSGPRGYAD